MRVRPALDIKDEESEMKTLCFELFLYHHSTSHSSSNYSAFCSAFHLRLDSLSPFVTCFSTVSAISSLKSAAEGSPILIFDPTLLSHHDCLSSFG